MQRSVAMIGGEESSGPNSIPHNLQVMSPVAGMASGDVSMQPQPITNGAVLVSFSEQPVFATAALASLQTAAVAPYGLNAIPMRLTASHTHVTNVSFAEGADLVSVPADQEFSPERRLLCSQIQQLEQYIYHVEHHRESTIVSNRNNLEVQAHAALCSQ